MLGHGRFKKVIALMFSLSSIFILASCTLSSNAGNALQADGQSAAHEHQKHKGYGGYGGGRGGGGVGGR
ncbi:hypothetical protein [Legionella pneumophila]|uniref:hypothetical protein n=1 Tax=Legionella pneumophila TaxID=446 RepID=UPI000D06E2E3|nr:hypothetical protein [Legionella pneumophila]